MQGEVRQLSLPVCFFFSFRYQKTAAVPLPVIGITEIWNLLFNLNEIFYLAVNTSSNIFSPIYIFVNQISLLGKHVNHKTTCSNWIYRNKKLCQPKSKAP